MNKYVYIVISFFFYCTTVYAQEEEKESLLDDVSRTTKYEESQIQIDRQEIDYTNENSYYYKRIIPFAEQGCIIKSIERERWKQQCTYHIDKFDTTLTKQDSTEYTIKTNKSEIIEYASKTDFYTISYSYTGRCSIVHFPCNDISKQTVLSLQIPKRIVISDIRVAGDYIYLLGRNAKSIPMMLIIHRYKGTLAFGKILSFSKKNFSILSFECNEENNEVYVFTKDYIKNTPLIKLYIYKDGEAKEEQKIQSPREDVYFTSAFASRLNDKSLLISGTYATTQRNTAASVGLYLMKLNDSATIDFVKLVNYLDIENFTSYLSTHKQKRIEKIRERKSSQDEELEMNYLMTPHKIIEQNGEFVLVAESYTPTFRMECNYISTPTGMTSHCYQVFDGYDYSHFFLYAFDENGNTLWSNAQPMHIDYKPFSITQFLSINKDPRSLLVMYPTVQAIEMFRYEKGRKISQDTIALVKDDEKLLRSSSKTVHWYNNNFLSYGSQKIKNLDEKTKRDVFFFEKVTIPIQ